jgi:hypothetical protein
MLFDDRDAALLPLTPELVEDRPQRLGHREPPLDLATLCEEHAVHCEAVIRLEQQPEPSVRLQTRRDPRGLVQLLERVALEPAMPPCRAHGGQEPSVRPALDRRRADAEQRGGLTARELLRMRALQRTARHQGLARRELLRHESSHCGARDVDHDGDLADGGAAAAERADTRLLWGREARGARRERAPARRRRPPRVGAAG